ncbi:hypothetical protein GALL_52060 [mine drainage metagenome]|uniref:Uncharacterized protein n=1 Tax=mine drainage metagenome TaxID=410659 RepID=A0A1J5SXY2_9ZZZZ
MYSAEVLSQLRTLNWLSQEARRLPFDSAERQILCAQIEALRARLPLSMLRHHDDRAKRNLPSIANIQESCCGYCRSELPEGTLHALIHPGRFGVCPNCGVFLWSASTAEIVWDEEFPPERPEPRKRRSAAARPRTTPNCRASTAATGSKSGTTAPRSDATKPATQHADA